MTKEYARAKEAAKELVLKYGVNGILNMHFTEAQKKAGVSSTDLSNALDYFRYSPKAAKYRV